MEENGNRKKTRLDVLKSLRKSFGDDAVISGDTVLSVSADPIPTGSYMLDNAIGIGGIPRARITQFAGAPASGKTFMSLQCVRSWQMMDPKNYAVWFDAEFSFDPTWATRLGIDMNRLDVVRENDGTKIFNVLCGVPHPKTHKMIGGILNEIIEECGQDSGCGLIVLDSIASIVTPVESGFELGHQNMAPLARFLPAVLRRLTPLLEKANIAMIFINQIRVDPGVQYGNPETTPGGNCLKHYERLMINFNKSFAGDKKIENKNGEPIGHTIMARIDKNSLGLPGRKLDIRIKYYEGVVDHNIEILALGTGYGIITRPNNRTYLYKDYKWTSKDEALKGLSDPAIIKQIWEEVIDVQKSGRGFNDNNNELEELEDGE